MQKPITPTLSASSSARHSSRRPRSRARARGRRRTAGRALPRHAGAAVARAVQRGRERDVSPCRPSDRAHVVARPRERVQDENARPGPFGRGRRDQYGRPTLELDVKDSTLLIDRLRAWSRAASPRPSRHNLTETVSPSTRTS